MEFWVDNFQGVLKFASGGDNIKKASSLTTKSAFLCKLQTQSVYLSEDPARFLTGTALNLQVSLRSTDI